MNCKDCSAEAGACVCRQGEPCAMCPKVAKAAEKAIEAVLKDSKVLEMTGIL
jgi:hypothetical protein